jgi:hypothetical protein
MFGGLGETFDPVKAVFIQTCGEVIEIDLDITGKKNEIFNLLKGSSTFIGQWPELDVVIMKCKDSILELELNTHVLPPPFENEKTFGSILLVRMDENSDPKDFTLREYREWASTLHPEAPPSSTSSK